jgi:hypothetical protein
MVDRLLHRPYPFRCLLLILARWALLFSIGANAAAADFLYIVRPGDKPWNLSERYLKSFDYWPSLRN